MHGLRKSVLLIKILTGPARDRRDQNVDLAQARETRRRACILHLARYSVDGHLHVRKVSHTDTVS